MTRPTLYLHALRTHVAAVALATAACASGSWPELGPPAPELEARYVAATAVATPLLLRFDWALAEREARFSGRGVARIEGERARIDLFGPRGEAYLAAVLDGGELVLPPGVSQAPVPPPSLLWAALGIFRPPQDARFSGSATDAAGATLSYREQDADWRFHFREERLTGAERRTGEGGRQQLELDGVLGAGRPRVASYRDFVAVRELRLSFTDVEDVAEGFPPETWWPGEF